MIIKANRHFAQRVRERMGDDIDADCLATLIVQSIRNEDGLLRWKAKLSPVEDGVPRSLWWFPYRGERRYVIVAIDGKKVVPVTVLRPGGTVRKSGRKRAYMRSGRPRKWVNGRKRKRKGI